jgi:hypothetical protein
MPVTLLLETEQAGVAVTLQTCLQEVLGSNLGRDTGYADRLLVLFLSSPG